MSLCLLHRLHPIPNGDQLAIDVLQACDQRIPNGLFNLLLDQTCRQGLDSLVQEIVLGIAD